MAETPYVLDIDLSAGYTAQTLINLQSVLADISVNPKPKYSVHGHSYDWPGLYAWLSGEIEKCIRRLNQLQPYEFVSIAR